MEGNKKTVLTCESGRMVILEAVPDCTGNAMMISLAQEGKEEGYILYSTLPSCPFDDCGTPGLFLSILTRPQKLPLPDAGMLSAAAATAVARATEKLAPIEVRIRWAGDLFHGDEKLAAMVSSTRLSPDGGFDWAVIGITVCLSPDHFPPKMGDVIRRVFSGETRDLTARLSETIATEFFAIYDRLLSDRTFLAEYRTRALAPDQRVKVLVGDTYLRGRVTDIDDQNRLIVTLHGDNEITVASRSEVVFL